MVATYTKKLAKPCIFMVPSCSFFLYKITQIFRLVAIIIYYIKLKSHPSVRPSVRIFLVEWIFAVDARIHVKLARNEVPVFWEHEVCFYNVLTPAVRHLRRFECQGVDDSCRNFTYIPANRSPDTIDNIIHLFSVMLIVQCAVVVTHPTRD